MSRCPQPKLRSRSRQSWPRPRQRALAAREGVPWAYGRCLCHFSWVREVDWLCSHLIIKSGERTSARSLSIFGGRFFVSYTTKVAGLSARVYGVLTFHSPFAVQVGSISILHSSPAPTADGGFQL